jgi:protein transport protein SEC31
MSMTTVYISLEFLAEVQKKGRGGINIARPGIAQVSKTQTAPVSASSLHEGHLADISADHHPTRDCLLSLVEALKQTQLSTIDKRQLAEAEKALAVLLKRLGRGGILPSDISEKVGAMTGYITSHDFRSAQSIQTGLVSHDWRDHKDWLKGFKALLQLATKKFER